MRILRILLVGACVCLPAAAHAQNDEYYNRQSNELIAKVKAEAQVKSAFIIGGAVVIGALLIAGSIYLSRKKS